MADPSLLYTSSESTAVESAIASPVAAPSHYPPMSMSTTPTPTTTPPAFSTTPFVAIHIGAGWHSRVKEGRYAQLINSTLDSIVTWQEGDADLEPTKSAMDILVAVLNHLESSPLTNAGRGSNLNFNAQVECDAAVMTGDGEFGSVCGLQGILHPIEAAALLAQENARGPHPVSGRVPPMMLCGHNATRYCLDRGLEGTISVTSTGAPNLLPPPPPSFSSSFSLDMLQSSTSPMSSTPFTSVPCDLSNFSRYSTNPSNPITNITSDSMVTEDSRKRYDEYLSYLSPEERAHPNAAVDLYRSSSTRSSTSTRSAKAPYLYNYPTTTNTISTSTTMHFDEGEMPPSTPPSYYSTLSVAEDAAASAAAKISTMKFKRPGSACNHITPVDGSLSGPGEEHHECKEDLDLISDTIGAIVMDRHGNIVAGVSSGGISLKYPGRVGEAAVFGAGVWADSPTNEHPIGMGCSVSGSGELITKCMIASQCSRFADAPDLEKHLAHMCYDFIYGKYSKGYHDIHLGCLLFRTEMLDVMSECGEGSRRPLRELWWTQTSPSFCLGWKSGNGPSHFQMSRKPDTEPFITQCVSV